MSYGAAVLLLLVVGPTRLTTWGHLSWGIPRGIARGSPWGSPVWVCTEESPWSAAEMYGLGILRSPRTAYLKFNPSGKKNEMDPQSIPKMFQGLNINIICDIMEAFFGFSNSLFARCSGIPWCSPQPNQEMLVTRLPAIRFCLNHYGFEYFFKPDLSSMVSGP